MGFQAPSQEKGGCGSPAKSPGPCSDAGTGSGMHEPLGQVKHEAHALLRRAHQHPVSQV